MAVDSVLSLFPGADTIFVMTSNRKDTVLSVSFGGETVDDTKVFVSSEEDGASSEQAFDFIQDFEESLRDDFEAQGKVVPVRLFAGHDESGEHFVYVYYSPENLPKTIMVKEDGCETLNEDGFEVDEDILNCFYTKNEDIANGFSTYNLN